MLIFVLLAAIEASRGDRLDLDRARAVVAAANAATLADVLKVPNRRRKRKAPEDAGASGSGDADEVPDPQNLRIWLEVDGERRQDGTTADMIFGVRFLVSHLSQFMRLRPGDIITTGTPAGVGMGMTPETYLEPGQRIRLGVEGLGEQRQTVVQDG